MTKSILLTQLARKRSNKEAIAAKVIRRPGFLPEVLKGLSSDKAEIKYGCSKVLRIISGQKPEILLPGISVFINLLDSENTFLKWDAIRIVANLAGADTGRRIDRILNRYLRPIRGHVMITAANVIGSAAKIALARPELTDKIARQILGVERAEYQTAECRNVAIGHAITSFDQFFDLIGDKQAVVKFAQRQLTNPRSAVRVKAAKFLKRHRLAPK